jgi:hypothetical protein
MAFHDSQFSPREKQELHAGLALAGEVLDFQ